MINSLYLFFQLKIEYFHARDANFPDCCRLSNAIQLPQSVPTCHTYHHKGASCICRRSHMMTQKLIPFMSYAWLTLVTLVVLQHATKIVRHHNPIWAVVVVSLATFNHHATVASATDWLSGSRRKVCFVCLLLPTVVATSRTCRSTGCTPRIIQIVVWQIGNKIANSRIANWRVGNKFCFYFAAKSTLSSIGRRRCYCRSVYVCVYMYVCNFCEDDFVIDPLSQADKEGSAKLSLDSVSLFSL